MFSIKINNKYYVDSPRVVIDDNKAVIEINVHQNKKNKLKFLDNFRTSNLSINGKAVINNQYVIRLVGYC